jgi:hypothetical protein
MNFVQAFAQSRMWYRVNLVTVDQFPMVDPFAG